LKTGIIISTKYKKDLNEFIFPHGVSEFYQDLNTNNLHFIKENKPCVISITPDGQKFKVTSTKKWKRSVKV